MTEMANSELLPSAAVLSNDFPQRIPYPEGNENATGVYGKLTNGQRISGHLPPAIKAAIGVQSGALLHDGQLSPALREMIIVRTGYRIGSIYEVEQHRSLAERYGVPPVKLDALARRVPAGLAADESSAISFVDELLTLNRPTDDALASLRDHFSYGEIIEIIFVTGNWWTLGKMLETAGIPLDSRRIGESGLNADGEEH